MTISMNLNPMGLFFCISPIVSLSNNGQSFFLSWEDLSAWPLWHSSLFDFLDFLVICILTFFYLGNAGVQLWVTLQCFSLYSMPCRQRSYTDICPLSAPLIYATNQGKFQHSSSQLMATRLNNSRADTVPNLL